MLLITSVLILYLKNKKSLYGVIVSLQVMVAKKKVKVDNEEHLSFHLITTRSAAIFSFTLYFLFIFAVAWFAGEELFTVFFGFFAVFLYLIATFILLYLDFAMAEIVYLFPIVLGAAFYALWHYDVSPLLSAMNGPMLTVLNVVVSFVFAAILSILHPHGVDKLRGGLGVVIEHPEPILSDNHEEEVSFEKTHSSHRGPEILPLPIEAKPMSVTIRGIEDKSKAINFVIGRVYSAKRGGSKEIREMIGIPKELYNAFSELVQDDEIVNPKELLSVVSEIAGRLHQLEQKESDLFELNDAKIQVERSSDGNDSVLSVLSLNDKDPIAEYHSEALEVCSQVIKYLERM